MSGYTGKANTFLNVLGMFPTGSLHNMTPHESQTTKYEYNDIPADGSFISVANPDGGLKIQVKFDT